jgi:hypothetical protein
MENSDISIVDIIHLTTISSLTPIIDKYPDLKQILEKSKTLLVIGIFL